MKWRRQFLTGLAQAISDHARLHRLLVTRTTSLSILTSSVGVAHGITQIFDPTIREFSDPDTALADYCGQVIAETSALHGASPRKLHSWLVASFITGRDTLGGLREDTTTTDNMPTTVLRGAR